MLRFDKTITFSPILKSSLSVSLSTKTFYFEVLLFSEFINIVSIVYIDLIMLWYTFLVLSFDWYKEKTICLISFSKLSELLPAVTCARAIGNLWSICLGINILSLDWLVFKMPEPLDFIINILLATALRTFSLPSKKLSKFLKTISLSFFSYHSAVLFCCLNF